MDYRQFCTKELNALKQKGHYRTFNTFERIVGSGPYAIWHGPDNRKHKVTVFCSNDYLGMSHNPEVISATQSAIDKYGVGSGGTRNISGTALEHVMLEQKVAQLHNKEAGLLFTSGYIANQASLEVLGSQLPNCVIFSDEKNHASMIHGIRHSRARKVIFPHNDMEFLEQRLKEEDFDTPKVIACVSIYSMDGDFANLHKIIELAKKYNALTFLDEVHAVGVYGSNGGGVAEHLGVSSDIDIIQANFAKGYGVMGGYIASHQVITDFIRSFAPSFIFTTSLPPSVTAACRAAIDLQISSNHWRDRLWNNINFLKQKMKEHDLPLIKNESHIVPFVVGDAKKCKEWSDRLLSEHKIYLQPINFPTVPHGQERFRITVTPDHEYKHIEALCIALKAVSTAKD